MKVSGSLLMIPNGLFWMLMRIRHGKLVRLHLNIFTFGVYIIGQSLETIVKVVTAGEFVSVGALYIKILKTLTWIFPNLRAFDLKVNIAYGIPLSLSYTSWTAMYGVFYISIIIFLTATVFRYQEIK